MCDTRWNDYNSWNPINKISAECGVKIVSWLKNDIDISKKNLLDYGCGNFSVGKLLTDTANLVDGFDPCLEYIESAQSVTSQFRNVRLFTDRKCIPQKTYDIIFLNSVVQYMEDKEDVLNFLYFADQLLKDDKTAALILSDLIPKDYSPTRDAINSLVYSSRNHFFIPMFTYLWKAATKPSQYQLLPISKSEIQELSDKSGFQCEFLNDNLTHSAERFSCVLKRKQGIV